MLVPICVKSSKAYRHHYNGMGPQTCMVFFVTVLVLLNIGPHAGVVSV